MTGSRVPRAGFTPRRRRRHRDSATTNWSNPRPRHWHESLLPASALTSQHVGPAAAQLGHQPMGRAELPQSALAWCATRTLTLLDVPARGFHEPHRQRRFNLFFPRASSSASKSLPGRIRGLWLGRRRGRCRQLHPRQGVHGREGEVNAGIAEQGDNQEFRAPFRRWRAWPAYTAAATSLLSGEYFKNKGIKTGASSKWASQGWHRFIDNPGRQPCPVRWSRK